MTRTADLIFLAGMTSAEPRKNDPFGRRLSSVGVVYEDNATIPLCAPKEGPRQLPQT
jgi:hypothetical protein